MLPVTIELYSTSDARRHAGVAPQNAGCRRWMGLVVALQGIHFSAEFMYFAKLEIK